MNEFTMIEELMQSKYHDAVIHLRDKVMFWQGSIQQWEVNDLKMKVNLYRGESIEEAIKTLTKLKYQKI